LQSTFFLVVITLLFEVSRGLPENQEFIKRLQAAYAVTNASITSIFSDWQVDKYPNFLKSCFMHKHSWDIMKLKFMDRILSAENSKSRKSFIASFLGSSVTAGQDSFFNQSTPIVTGNLLKPAFDALNIDFIAKNVALIGNPCMPYDVCLKIFVGLDADIVHWEQTYFCGPFGATYILEQFVRQAMSIPTRPIVVFSESSTGHWEANQCKKGPHTLTTHELELLHSTDLKVVSKLNKDEFERAWSFLHGIDRLYHQAGIQTFQHEKHSDYACLGPYISNWMAGAAPWHPSAIGHRMRAAHHGYFWLIVLREAIGEILRALSHKSKSDVTQRTSDLINHFYNTKPTFSASNTAPDLTYTLNSSTNTHLPTNKRVLPLGSIKPKFNSPFVDDIQCFTDYEPRSVRDNSLSHVIVSIGGWKRAIHNDLEDPQATITKKNRGFQDYMHIFYGNKDSGSLSMLATLAKPGPIFLCQSPATWGKMPEGFKFLWETKIDVFISLNVPSASKFPNYSTLGQELDKSTGAFKFQKASAIKANTIHNKDFDICIQLSAEGGNGTVFSKGTHIVTVMAKESVKIIVAWLLTA